MIDDLDADGLLGGVKPKFVSERPEFDIWLTYYLKAFRRLSTSRQPGMSIGYIPLSEIVNYADRFGEYDLEKFVDIIQNADNAFVKLHSPKEGEK